MQRLHVHVDRALSKECGEALRRFLGDIEGVASVEQQELEIDIRYDEWRLPGEQLLAMTRTCAEILGCHASFLSAHS